MDQRADIVIIGGGIVGLSTAYHAMQRFPRHRVVVLEKEDAPAAHQSGHNSGVLHSGIYYVPGSAKARACRAGKQLMEAFCQAEGIAYEVCGKVIVATTSAELPYLETLLERGKANGVRCEKISRERLAELEPHVEGLSALYVPEAGIADYRGVCQRLAEHLVQGGGAFIPKAEVTAFVEEKQGVTVITQAGTVRAGLVVSCGGLQADRLAALSGKDSGVRILPFRGEYFALTPSARKFCNNLIYPVPNPAFPFLGVHFTRMTNGEVTCGPNAVLALAREGYTRTTFDAHDLKEALSYPGLHQLAKKHWKTALAEQWRSWNKAAFLKTLQRLVPALKSEDLIPYPAGVRAQAVTPDGKLVDDFLIQETERIIHVINAPSPAATASLHIGQTLTDHIAARITA